MFEGPILRNHFNLIALSVTSYDFRTYVNAKNTCINYFSVNTNKCFQIENLYVIVIIKNKKYEKNLLLLCTELQYFN